MRRYLLIRIVYDSPELLSVTEAAVGLRITGGVLAVVGAVFVAIGLRTAHGLATVPGAASLVIGVMLVVLPAITTFYFNRSEKRLIVTRTHLWSRRGAGKGDEYSLRDVVAVQVDESRSDEGGSSWRVIVRLTDGRVLPFASYYTSGYQPKRDIANRICNFLGVPADTQSVRGQSSPTAITPHSRNLAIAGALIFVAFGAAFGSIGAVMLAREYRRFTEWQPVQATVISTRVDVRSDSDGDTYLPVVTYRYTVDDRSYTSSRALAINESRGGVWARRVIARFAAGETHTAWYDPANPSDAFIVRSHSIIAPVFTLIGAFVVIGGCAAGISAVRGKDVPL